MTSWYPPYVKKTAINPPAKAENIDVFCVVSVEPEKVLLLPETIIAEY